MKLGLTAILVITTIFCGCRSNIDDMQQFVRDSEKSVQHRIEPLPAIKPLPVASYEGMDLADPFKPRRLKPPKDGSTDSSAFAHERKGPLEDFPLDQLKMVGTLSRGEALFALVRANKIVYKVAKGNFMGQDLGRVIEITSSEIKLKELVQDDAGDWVERQSVLALQENAGKG